MPVFSTLQLSGFSGGGQLKLTNIVRQYKFGYSEEERQEIYKDLTKTEYNTIDNPEMYPKYVKQLAKEFNTTDAILDSISTEGFIKGWTMYTP